MLKRSSIVNISFFQLKYRILAVKLALKLDVFEEIFPRFMTSSNDVTKQHFGRHF